ncbi:MAG: hypothetical protein ACRC92_26425 [Peptostreptococcaceae bacterium]
MKLVSRKGYVLCEVKTSDEDGKYGGLVGLDANDRYKEYVVVEDNNDDIPVGDIVVAEGTFTPHEINGKDYYVIDMCQVIAVIYKGGEK